MARKSLAKRIGSRIRARRKARGLSQAKLAELVELSPNYVGMIERGEKTPTLGKLVAFAEALGTKPGALLGDDAPADDWLDEMATVASNVPPKMRPVTLAVLRAIAYGK
jgi:transcriptional regulator with XRE-family HTH domain